MYIQQRHDVDTCTMYIAIVYSEVNVHECSCMYSPVHVTLSLLSGRTNVYMYMYIWNCKHVKASFRYGGQSMGRLA